MYIVPPEAQPLISAICITADRLKYVDKAIACFLEQTWENKELIIYDSGEERVQPRTLPGIRWCCGDPATIGELRNAAIEFSKGKLIANWDDDDWSHPSRMAEQAELLMASDAEVTGYSSIVFHDTIKDNWWLYRGETDYASGASLMFRRVTWEKRRFPALPQAEDNAFIYRRHLVTSYGHRPVRLIARHHRASTSPSWARFQVHPRIQTNWTQIKAEVDIRGLRALLK